MIFWMPVFTGMTNMFSERFLTVPYGRCTASAGHRTIMNGRVEKTTTELFGVHLRRFATPPPAEDILVVHGPIRFASGIIRLTLQTSLRSFYHGATHLV